MGAADGLGYLTPWYLSVNNMEVENSQKTDNILLNFHPLTKRAVELQTRLEVFKRDLNIFYSKALRTYGKWRTNSETPAIGSIVYILDKTTTKANFLLEVQVGTHLKLLVTTYCGVRLYKSVRKRRGYPESHQESQNRQGCKGDNQKVRERSEGSQRHH